MRLPIDFVKINTNGLKSKTLQNSARKKRHMQKKHIEKKIRKALSTFNIR